MIKHLTLLLTLAFSMSVRAQTVRYPAAVETVLKQAGKNRAELEKALTHYDRSDDTLKMKAIRFLIANMDIHYAEDYFWADSAGKKVPFNELDYPDFAASVQAFDTLKRQHQGLHPVPVQRRDIDTITAAYLVDNIDRAFESWKNAPVPSSFENFCEYVLPYRISVEPVQNWRTAYHEKFRRFTDSAANKSYKDMLMLYANDYKSWFVNTYNKEKRLEPLPRLGAMQLLHRKKGACEDIADLEVFSLRSQGIPATVDLITYWASSFGSHFFNSTFTGNGQTVPFDAMRSNDVDITGATKGFLAREPAKVIRLTYSKQPGVIASVESEKNIPEGFMRVYNYKDVTAEYWDTRDLHVKLFSNKYLAKTAYLYVYNYGKWRPGWWGRVRGDSAVFTNMAKGCVFLPVYYRDGKKRVAGYPVASGYRNLAVLKPDTVNKRTITINWQENYLVFRPEKNYKLYYWDTNWKLCGQKKAAEGTEKLVFEQVPNNALLLLVPEYSQHKERPFIITGDGQRVWF